MEVTPAAVGGLIALFERAVGLYLTGWHQMPITVEKAASAILAVRKAVIDHLGILKEVLKQLPKLHKQSDNLERIHGLKF